VGEEVTPDSLFSAKRIEPSVQDAIHPEILSLLRMLDEGYNQEAWHGPNLRGSLNRLTLAQALWRPTPKHRNLWELTLHCAYWKYVVWRKVAGGLKRGAFPRKGSDWYPRTEGTLEEFRADFALLDDMHAKLRESVAELDPARLHEAAGGSNALAFYIRGAAMHDVYHAGQAQWIKQGMSK
jgi:hypothetical protein